MKQRKKPSWRGREKRGTPSDGFVIKHPGGRVPVACGCDAQAGERKDTACVLVHSLTSPQSTQASLATEGSEAVGNVPASGSRNRIGARGRILRTTTVNFH